jgi:polysaccharide biosynthesis transport protein
MIAELKRQYDIVLIDTPAVGNSADAIRVASLADTTVVVVRRDTANTDDVVATIARLRADGRKVSGIVLNSDRKCGRSPKIDIPLPQIQLVSESVVKKIASRAKSRSSIAKA